jgi:hypothetical protein
MVEKPGDTRAVLYQQAYFELLIVLTHWNNSPMTDMSPY